DTPWRRLLRGQRIQHQPYLACKSITWEPNSIRAAVTSGIQDRFYLAGESIRGKRFLDEVGSFLQYALMDDGVVRITGHIEDLGLRAYQDQTIDQLAPAHFRHHDIGQ